MCLVWYGGVCGDETHLRSVIEGFESTSDEVSRLLVGVRSCRKKWYPSVD